MSLRCLLIIAIVFVTGPGALAQEQNSTTLVQELNQSLLYQNFLLNREREIQFQETQRRQVLPSEPLVNVELGRGHLWRFFKQQDHLLPAPQGSSCSDFFQLNKKLERSFLEASQRAHVFRRERDFSMVRFYEIKMLMISEIFQWLQQIFREGAEGRLVVSSSSQVANCEVPNREAWQNYYSERTKMVSQWLEGNLGKSSLESLLKQVPELGRFAERLDRRFKIGSNLLSLVALVPIGRGAALVAKGVSALPVLLKLGSQPLRYRTVTAALFAAGAGAVVDQQDSGSKVPETLGPELSEAYFRSLIGIAEKLMSFQPNAEIVFIYLEVIKANAKRMEQIEYYQSQLEGDLRAEGSLEAVLKKLDEKMSQIELQLTNLRRPRN